MRRCPGHRPHLAPARSLRSTSPIVFSPIVFTGMQRQNLKASGCRARALPLSCGPLPHKERGSRCCKGSRFSWRGQAPINNAPFISSGATSAPQPSASFLLAHGPAYSGKTSAVNHHIVSFHFTGRGKARQDDVTSGVLLG